ncbi:MAG: ABC transporter ATP-binding protein [Candidatus Bathyarchaeia archaeon]
MSGKDVSVSLRNLTKRYGRVVAVNDLSLDVFKEELFCLLGPSGAGKTTVVRMIAGIETPDEGEIYIEGVNVTDVAPKDRDVAMMFQSYALYPNKTVRENLALPLKVRKMPRQEVDSIVKEVAEILHITHLLDKLPGQLSGGERQRLAIGRAIVRKPKVYILDEPLTNLDAKLRVEMRGELKRLQRELKATTIFNTPDEAEALTMADRIAVMNQGRVQQVGTPEEVYESPKNMFVAKFVGSPPMNMLEGSLVERNGKTFIDVGELHYDVTDLADLMKKGLKSNEVILGVRPEHIHISKKRRNDSIVGAKVYVIEPTKPEMIVDLKLGEKILKALAPSTESYSLDEEVWLSFDRDKIHIIDKKTQEVVV